MWFRQRLSNVTSFNSPSVCFCWSVSPNPVDVLVSRLTDWRLSMEDFSFVSPEYQINFFFSFLIHSQLYSKFYKSGHIFGMLFMIFGNFWTAPRNYLKAFCRFGCVKFTFASRFPVFTGIPSGGRSFPFRIVPILQTSVCRPLAQWTSSSFFSEAVLISLKYCFLSHVWHLLCHSAMLEKRKGISVQVFRENEVNSGSP